jgi:hypothetical protein
MSSALPSKLVPQRDLLRLRQQCQSMDDERPDERIQRAAANAPVHVRICRRGEFPGELFRADFLRGRHDATSSAGAGAVAGAETLGWEQTGKQRTTRREKSTTRPKMQKAVSDHFH